MFRHLFFSPPSGDPGRACWQRCRGACSLLGRARAGRWRAAAVFSHSFPRSSSLLSVALVTGTIRKAQNLLKQYSQHGLDGKKGGSNLIPLEGNPLCSFRHPSSTVCPLTYLAGQSLPQEGLGANPEGTGWEWQTPDASRGSTGPRTSFMALAWSCLALPFLRLLLPVSVIVSCVNSE